MPASARALSILIQGGLWTVSASLKGLRFILAGLLATAAPLVRVLAGVLATLSFALALLYLLVVPRPHHAFWPLLIFALSCQGVALLYEALLRWLSPRLSVRGSGARHEHQLPP
jgi:hypothetical protein